MKLTQSKKLLLKSAHLIPGSSQTFSKAPTQFVRGVCPSFLERAKGCYVWDVDGNSFIDYAMALGPIILGHNYPTVTRAVQAVLHKGTTFTLPHRMEIDLSELLTRLIPCAEMVRFGKNGSDVTSGAVRVARAYTGREKIACCGYHGWQDWYIATTTRDAGIPRAVKKLTIPFKYNEIQSLERIFQKNPNEIACVIMEPMGVVEPEDGFLSQVKEMAHKHGALLIFDEVVTGFRFALGGAQKHFQVLPDLACFGKAMANGFPISAVVGKKEIMKYFDEVFFSFTFGGEIVSIVAAIATIQELKKENVIAHLWKMGKLLRDTFNEMAHDSKIDDRIQCRGAAPRTIITFKNENGEDDLLLKSFFQQECVKQGILFTGGHNICFSHTQKVIEKTLRVYRNVLKLTQTALSSNKISKWLEGKPVQSVFRKA